jgi:cell division protein FtsW (lipid II flippase)
MIQKISLFSKKTLLAVSILLLSTLTYAQDKKVDININSKSDNENVFMQPWVWVVGGAIFILLLVALLRGSKK